jgi:hypothetical protein
MRKSSTEIIGLNVFLLQLIALNAYLRMQRLDLLLRVVEFLLVVIHS